MKTNCLFHLTFLILSSLLSAPNGQSQDLSKPTATSLFAKDNLVAWCIVPFDAKQRGPEERAAMIRDLGLNKVAYDWRKPHIPQFEEEILAYQKHGLEFFAFWSWHDSLEPLVKKHGIRPQIWITAPSPAANLLQDQQVEDAAKQLASLAKTTQRLGLTLGLYNHGGWGGEPKNLVAVCQRLRELHQSEQIGIVYNFHHGHAHIADFAESLQLMLPYLLCLNVNGMADPAQVDVRQMQHKIKPIGTGAFESEMLTTIVNSGYQGPIGILDHRNDLDTEIALRQNLAGLDTWQRQLTTNE